MARSKTTSFLLSAAREEEDLVAVVYAQGLQGPIKENVPTPQVNTVASLRISRQLSEKQALFVQSQPTVGRTTSGWAEPQLRRLEHRLVFARMS